MRTPTVFFAFLLSVACGSAAETGLKHYLYLSTPDGAQKGGSGNGILVFDVDDGHRFVRRIDVPIFKEGLRGFCGNTRTRCVYYSTTSRRLGCFDLVKEKVVWDRQYEAGCDRATITPDGKKIYVPTGWWFRGTNSGFLVVDPSSGDVINRIAVGPQAHNSLTSLDGSWVLLGTETNLAVFRTADDGLVRSINGVGERGVFPFTIDSQSRFAYVCLGQHVGFDVVDLKTGEVPYRIFASEEKIEHRTHGVGLTPDERELWVSDQVGQKLFIFDATKMPPAPAGWIALSAGGHGWVTFSQDGRYAWCHTPDVIDVASRRIVATLRDENGEPVSGSKFVEVHFRDGRVVFVGDQFAIGRRHPVAQIQ